MLAQSVADAVEQRAYGGIDYLTDGDFSKPGFFSYIQARLDGFKPRPDQKFTLFEKEVAAFPEYYEQYFKDAMLGGAAVRAVPKPMNFQITMAISTAESTAETMKPL